MPRWHDSMVAACVERVLSGVVSGGEGGDTRWGGAGACRRAVRCEAARGEQRGERRAGERRGEERRACRRVGRCWQIVVTSYTQAISGTIEQ